MRKLIVILLVIIPGLAMAQYPGYTLSADLAKFKEQFSLAAQKTSSIKSDFVQEKNLAMLSEKIV